MSKIKISDRVTMEFEVSAGRPCVRLHTLSNGTPLIQIETIKNIYKEILKKEYKESLEGILNET